MNKDFNPAIAAYDTAYERIYTRLYWDIANVIGLTESVVIQIIHDWCSHNRKNKNTSYFRKGCWWTSGKYEYWAKTYPCIGSPKTFQRLLRKLEGEGYIVSEQFLKSSGNNVKFYRINKESVGNLLLNEQDEPIETDCPDDDVFFETPRQFDQMIKTKSPDVQDNLTCSLYINRSIDQTSYITPPEPGLAPTQEYKNREKLESLLDKGENPSLGWSDSYSNRQTNENLFSCLKTKSSHPSEITPSGSILPRRLFDNLEQLNNATRATTGTTCNTVTVEVVSEVIPTTDKTKTDRGSDEYADFLDAYKAYKPSNFTEHRKISAQQGKRIKALIKECGGDRDLALDKLVSALCFVREDKNDFWRKGQFSLDNLLSNGKVVQYSDKHDCLYTIDEEYRDRVTGKRGSRDRGYAHPGEQYFDNNGNELAANSAEAREIKAASDPFLQMLLNAKV